MFVCVGTCVGYFVKVFVSFLKIDLFYFYVYECFAYVCITRMPIGYLGTEVIEGCEPP